jgi:hypothetical protein
MTGWQTPDEERALRKKLARNISFESVVKKYSNRIEPVSSATWTHKCACPFHKGGNERTPSLHISDTEKTFFCYGCSVRGDVFDFIGMVRGAPGSAVAERYSKSQNITLETGDVVESRPRINIHEFNLKIGISIREYLKSLTGSATFENETSWAEETFKRVDERFAKLKDEDGDQARNFYIQIMMEIDRRRS